MFIDKVDSILKELSEVFDRLANCIRCPKCGTDVCGEKFNLGEKYSSFEGCKKCADEEKAVT